MVSGKKKVLWVRTKYLNKVIAPEEHCVGLKTLIEDPVVLKMRFPGFSQLLCHVRSLCAKRYG